MTLRAILTLSASFAAAAILLPYTATAQERGQTPNSASVQKASYQPISPAAIAVAIETSVVAGEHDKLLQYYGNGVAQAFREAYAINVMNPLWTEESAQELIMAVSVMEDQGVVQQNIKQQANQAFKNRFDGFNAEARAQGDMALSMTYIHLEDLRHGSDTDASKMAPPRLAGLDSHLISAAGAGNAGHEDGVTDFNSF